jgi:hypothetical protein
MFYPATQPLSYLCLSLLTVPTLLRDLTMTQSVCGIPQQVHKG